MRVTASGIDYSIEIEAGVQAIVDSQGRYFTVSMSCDELPKNASFRSIR